MKKSAVAFASLFLGLFPAGAQVTLPKVFSSHMVLQRDQPIHVWGDAAPGESVEVSLHRSRATATADNSGRWSAYLPAEPAGGPYSLSAKGSTTTTLDDVLIGDLWIASGQSNMEMPLNGFPGSAVVKDAEKEIAAANFPQIRLMVVHKDSSIYPLADVKAVDGWAACTPQTARSFSAVGYFFARDLQARVKVPIGIVDTTWGGTPAEAWTSETALSADAGLMPVYASYATRAGREERELRLDAIDKQLRAAGKPVPPRATGWHPDLRSWSPSGLFNAMVAPFTPLRIRGVIWYQGESNAGSADAPLYHHLFSTLITDWRQQWGEGDFPFLFVQISSFDAGKQSWGTLRDAQRRTLALQNTGMAVTLDAGDPHNVHPANKQIVGERLSLLARNIAFGEKIVASGPLFRTAWPENGSMHIAFDDAAGLKSNGTLEGFEVAGADGNFVPATATIQGDAVIASSTRVTDPMYVRYAWSNVTPAPLVNAAGLPASTFTSYPQP